MSNKEGNITTGETLVREWANFHPDIPLTRSYVDLARRIDSLVNKAGCPHCSCSCDRCAPCGDEL